jgi:putative phosphoesterase
MKNKADPSWTLLCAEILPGLLQALAKEAEGARSREDVENVHRMRVASRRIRSAMDIFEDCLPPKRFKVWRKEVRRITRALGAARDADVQIDLLSRLKTTVDKKAAPGLEMAMSLKQQGRAALQDSLVISLGRLQRSGLVTEMASFLAKVKRDALKEGTAQVRSTTSFLMASECVRHRIEGLVKYEAYVHKEDAISEHHAMRIAAKRLRYTVEAFGPLFDDGLKDQLAWIKKLQELLGDLHDCDVWIEDARAMTNALKKGELSIPDGVDATRLKPGLVFLEQNQREERKRVYGQFTTFWDGLASAGSIASLEMRMDNAAGETSDQTITAIEKLVSNPKAEIAVLGDVHGNLEALRAVVEDAKLRGAQVVLNTGDVLGYGANPEETIRLLRSLPSINIIGNYDLKSMRMHEKGEKEPDDKAKGKLVAFRWAYENISPSSREWLRSLPKEARLEIGGVRTLMVHGSPDSMDEHLGPETSDERLSAIAADAGAGLIISGHSHRAMSRTVGKVRFLNPGSVGRQDDGDPRASYAMLRLRPFRARLFRISYDMEAAAQSIRDANLPPEFSQMLLQGRSYDFVVGKSEEGASDREGGYAKALHVSRAYLGADRHSVQVTRLATQLFDCLKREMRLTGKDRSRLRSAAILHDIGWVEGRKGHHKTSLRMILEEDALGLDRTERKVVGCIARYHRKALPSTKHAHYATLGKEERKGVDQLAAILRVADALDLAHDSKVRSVRCELTPDKIIIHCTATERLEMEEAEARKKGDLIQKVLGRDLELLWDVP